MTLDFTAIEDKYHLPHGLLYSQWQQESGCGRNMVSHAGAIGDFQFMPETRKEIMNDTKHNPKHLDPWALKAPNREAAVYESAECAAIYIDMQRDKVGGDIHAALAAYNTGAGRVIDSMRKHGEQWLSFLSKETREYGKRILDRIGFDGMVDFVGNYNHHPEYYTDDEVAQEREKFSDAAESLGIDKKQVDQMSNKDMFSESFLKLILALVIGLAQGQAAGKSQESSPQPVQQGIDAGPNGVPPSAPPVATPALPASAAAPALAPTK